MKPKPIELRAPAALGLDGDAKDALKLRLVSHDDFDDWFDAAGPQTRDWLARAGFTSSPGSAILFAEPEDGADAVAVIGARGQIWHGAMAAAALPAGRWAIHHESDKAIDTGAVCLGWSLAQYRFDDYRIDRGARDDADDDRIRFMALGGKSGVDGQDRLRIESLATGIAFCRDLINTPPNHMNPQGLADSARALARRFDAKFSEIKDKSLASGFPAIDTVGRAAECAPRLIDMRWGDKGPAITLVGKGITFDSGGLDIKPSNAMEIMKKDMGGAATVLGLAAAIMMAGVKVRLRVLVPAAENAISSRAMRPLDIMGTRAGINVEVGNTDAEGRLVLADALTLALEDKDAPPDLLVDFATLTGAARVALGTELPALFCNRDDTARDILGAGEACHDPLWRLPLFDDYERHLDAGYAALSSTGSASHGGAITAALFLRRFTGTAANWVHVDVMAWNLAARPGRPRGGEAMGLRAMFSHIAGLAGAQ